MSVTPSPFAAASRLVTSPRTRTPVFVTIAALVTAIAAGLTFRRATTPWSSLPDSDYWGNISGLITESGVRLDLANLFSPQQRAHRRHPEIDLRGELISPRRAATPGSSSIRWRSASPAPGSSSSSRARLCSTRRGGHALRAAVPFGDVQRQADPQLFSRHERHDLAHRRSLRHRQRRGACSCRRR